jgi:hypothetical protein
MTDIDLIPASYRESLRVQSWARYMLITVSFVLVMSITGYFTLDYMNQTLSAEISDLQSEQQISELQRDVLINLSEEKTRFTNQLSFLTGLRSGTTAQEMFMTVDRALENKEVWFLDWEFRRAGTAVEKDEKTSSNGYFIIIPATNGEKTAETWKIETHMTIKGQAKDHSALSRFVRKLFNQPEIQNVRILNTSRRAKARVVNFDLAVIVNSRSETG